MKTSGAIAAQIVLAALIALPLTPASAATVACPAQDFDSFLKHFANDIAVQKAFVSIPLQSDSIDPEAEPEPAPVSRQLDKAQIQFPLMPNEQQQRKQGLSLSKTASSADQVTLKLTKADTDYQLSLFFRHQDCWMLYRIKDDSL
jgi:hypothetical protein